MTATAKTASNAAETAAEAIRTLNHSTLHPADFTIGDLYRIVGRLATTTHRLRQTCDQLIRILEDRRPQLEHDDGHPSDDAVAHATMALGQAGALALALAHVLDQAHQTTASLRRRS